MTTLNTSQSIPIPNYPLAVTFIVLDFFTIVGNGFNIIAIVQTPDLRTQTGTCLLALAVTQLIFGIIFMPNAIILSLTNEWLLGDAVCKFEAIGSSICFLTSLCILATVSVDRYITIMKPLRYECLMTRNRLNAVIVISLVYSTAIMLPSLSIPNYLTVVYYCCTLDLRADTTGVYTTFLHLVGYLVPFSVIVFAYFHIIRAARQAQQVLPGNVLPADTETRTGNIKLAWQVLAVVGTFVFCCTPILCTALLSITTTVPWYITVASQVLAVSTNAINPIIYITINQPLKNYVLYLFRQCGNHCHRQQQKPTSGQ